MSFLLECPNCGRRPVDEYAYGGEVTVRPKSADDARGLFSYLYFRKNEAGERPLMVFDAAKASELTGPPAIDGIGPTAAIDGYWRRADQNRRLQAKWCKRQAA